MYGMLVDELYRKNKLKFKIVVKITFINKR